VRPGFGFVLNVGDMGVVGAFVGWGSPVPQVSGSGGWVGSTDQ
ncbi:hypothetical protein NPIL_550481, partial [Nephila pilipes]